MTTAALDSASVVRLDDEDAAPGEGPALDRLYDSTARRVCYAGSVIELAAGLVMLVTFWAAYGWTIIHGATAVALGCIGWSHYPNRQALAFNSCCCHAVPFTANQPYAQTTLAVFCSIATVTSVVAAVYSSDTVFRLVAVLNAIACVVACVNGIVMSVYNNRLIPYTSAVYKAVEDAQMVPYQYSSGGQSHVVMVQPQVYQAQPVYVDQQQQQLQGNTPNPLSTQPPYGEVPPYLGEGSPAAFPPSSSSWQYSSAADGNPYVSAYLPRAAPPIDPTSQQAPLATAPSAAEGQ